MKFHLLHIFVVFLEAFLTHGTVPDRQPNIIYILSDDLGHADVGFTNGNVKTPNLNRMVREGNTDIW